MADFECQTFSGQSVQDTGAYSIHPHFLRTGAWTGLEKSAPRSCRHLVVVLGGPLSPEPRKPRRKKNRQIQAPGAYAQSELSSEQSKSVPPVVTSTKPTTKIGSKMGGAPKIGSKMGGDFTNQNGIPWVLTTTAISQSAHVNNFIATPAHQSPFGKLLALCSFGLS